MECLDRLYLNGYIGKLATSGGLVGFMRGQLEKPIPSPVVLGQISERFRQAVKTQWEREKIPIYQFQHVDRGENGAILAGEKEPLCRLRDGFLEG